jgi:CcmD family protein
MTGLVIAAPALPLHSAGKYVAAAYIVFVLLILMYVAIMARRLSRTERELAQLRSEIGARESMQAQELPGPDARDREPDDGNRKPQPVR